MESTHEKNCQYCGEKFIPLRNTKKYCSNNCKQMDYFKRNGIIQSDNEEQKINTVETEETKEGVVVGNTSENEAQEISLFYDDTVIQSNEYSQLQPEITTKEKSRGSHLYIVKNDEENEISVKNNNNETENIGLLAVKELAGEAKEIPLYVKQDSVKYNKQSPAMKTIINKPNVKVKEYRYINSTFLNRIQEHLDQMWFSKLNNPYSYWGFDAGLIVKWVSPRIRCLFESLIKLSRFPFIDRLSLLAITDAFVRLTGTTQFKTLPNDYPYSNIVKELKDKLLVLLDETKGQETVRFRISTGKKAMLIAMRYEMKSFVESIKFSELTFAGEGIFYNINTMKNEEDEGANDEQEDVRTRYYKNRRRRRLAS